MEEVVQMTTDLRKLKSVVDEQSQENARLQTKLAKKDTGMKQLQIQLGMVKMEAQAQAKQLQKRKEVMEEANKQIAYLMEHMKEEPRKTTLHMKKIMGKFRK